MLLFFIVSNVLKNIHHKIVKKEVQKILNNSRNDEQFLNILYNTFNLKGK
jgi:mannitol/fructose-specific phosphotransferase system IIA component (Ntr-type)